MKTKQTTFFFIKLPYWLGIVADALWAIGLMYPPVFGYLTGRSDFNPDLEIKLIMWIGGSLFLGWTCLLLWAVKSPINRKFVILITAFPVVFTLFIVALIGFLNGNKSNIWILIKTFILFISMITSYIISSNIAKKNL